MALRLSRTVQQETTTTPPADPGTSNGIDVTLTYDLDKLEELKKRGSTGALIVENNNKKNEKEGGISVKTYKDKILMNNADAAKYLFGNEPSTNAYSPSVTLRRPIVLWEEGTLDDGTSERVKSIYEQIADLEKNMKEIIISEINKNFKIPTNISELNNDSNYVSKTSLEDSIELIRNEMNEKINQLIRESIDRLTGESIEGKLPEIPENPLVDSYNVNGRYILENLPEGTIVESRPGEIRLLCPESYWENLNTESSEFKITVKMIIPEENVEVKHGFQENNMETVEEYNGIEMLCAVKRTNNTWYYYGNSSSTSHFMGYTYYINVKNSDGSSIMESIRINFVKDEEQLNTLVDHSIN